MYERQDAYRVVLALSSSWGQPPKREETWVTLSELRSVPVGKRWSAPRPPYVMPGAFYEEATLQARERGEAIVLVRRLECRDEFSIYLPTASHVVRIPLVDRS